MKRWEADKNTQCMAAGKKKFSRGNRTVREKNDDVRLNQRIMDR